MASPTILPLLSLDDGLSAFSSFVEGLRTAPAATTPADTNSDARLQAAETRIAVLESQLLTLQGQYKDLLQQQAVQEATMKQGQQAHGSQLVDTVNKKCQETVDWTDKLVTEKCDALTHHVLSMVNDRLAEFDALGSAVTRDTVDAAALAALTEARLAQEGGEPLTGEALAALTASLAAPPPAAAKRPVDDTVSVSQDKGLLADVVADVVDAGHKVAAKVESAAEAAFEKTEDAAEKVEEVVVEAVEKVEEALTAMGEKIEDAVEALVEKIEDKLEFTHDLDNEPAVEPVVAETAEPVVEPVAEPVVEPLEPVVEPVEPAAEPVPEPVEPVPEPVPEPLEPVVEPVPEPLEPVVEPVPEPLEPVVEPVEPVVAETAEPAEEGSQPQEQVV